MPGRQAIAVSFLTHRARSAAWRSGSSSRYFPKPGWVEHDADEIWACQLGVAVEAMSEDRRGSLGILRRSELRISGRRPIVWDKHTGEPVYHAIVWQCRRTSEYCDSLKEKGLTETFREKTGLIIDAYFSGTKVKWILDHVPGARSTRRTGRAAVRNGRDMADLEADKRGRACDGLFECGADDAV